jgi:hypothetical protein
MNMALPAADPSSIFMTAAARDWNALFSIPAPGNWDFV